MWYLKTTLNYLKLFSKKFLEKAVIMVFGSHSKGDFLVLFEVFFSVFQGFSKDMNRNLFAY